MPENENLDQKLLLKEQARAVLEMKELMAEFGNAAVTADSKADDTFGDEHERHVGAKKALRELLRQLRKWAEFEAPKPQKAKQPYG